MIRNGGCRCGGPGLHWSQDSARIGTLGPSQRGLALGECFGTGAGLA